MRRSAVAVILVIAILCAGSLGYFAGISRQTATLVSTKTSTTTVYERTSTYLSPISSPGLQLEITLNSTTIQYGGALSAKVALLNTLPANLTLTPNYSSIISNWEGNDFICGNAPDWGEKWALDGFAVFTGHFTAANVSSAGSQLILAPPVGFLCISRPNPHTVVMLPASDVAVAKYNVSGLPPESIQTLINASTLSCAKNVQGGTSCGDLYGALFGYWDSSGPEMSLQDANVSSPHFHLFPPGQYTIVAEDQWGNLSAFAYFQVLAPTGYKGSTTTASSGVSSVTLPCGSPGVYCGGFNITSASLTANGSYSVLRVSIQETGNSYIGSATVYVNGTVIGNPPASEYEPPGNIPLDVQPGQQAVLVLTIPNSTITIRSGMTYSVLVYGWEGPQGERASEGDQTTVNIKAA